MGTVQDMLDTKDAAVWSIGPDDMVIDAIAKMAERRIGALSVVEGDKLIGIISERDYARKLILEGRDARATKVSEIMTSNVIVTKIDQSVEKCMAMMSHNQIRHLPVVDGDEKLVGIIAVDDVLKAMIREQSAALEVLEAYIKDEEGGSG